MIEPLDALKDKMVMVCKILQHQGVIDGYGHVTARLPDNKILSTPHMPPGKVAVRDLIILDADGKSSKASASPNGETAMHTSIYKARPDVQCILHYHADELVADRRHRSTDQSHRQLRRRISSRHADLRLAGADSQ